MITGIGELTLMLQIYKSRKRKNAVARLPLATGKFCWRPVFYSGWLETGVVAEWSQLLHTESGDLRLKNFAAHTYDDYATKCTLSMLTLQLNFWPLLRFSNLMASSPGRQFVQAVLVWYVNMHYVSRLAGGRVCPAIVSQCVVQNA